MIWQHFRTKKQMFSAPKYVTGTPVALMVICHKVGAIDSLTWFLAPTGPQN